MKKILVFQHVAYEILGTLHPLLKEAGFRIRYVNFGRDPQLKPNVDRYDGLVILGGGMNVHETTKYPHLLTEMNSIERAIKRKMPVLGICLGAQLIAATLGAKVKANARKEIGWFDVALTPGGQSDPLFGHFKKSESIFQWHGDTFSLPEGAVHLASSEMCQNQAFRYKNNVYGLQFHMEVDAPMIERWLKIPHHLDELKSEKLDIEEIRQQTKAHIDNLIKLSQKTFSLYIDLFSTKARRQFLPSR